MKYAFLPCFLLILSFLKGQYCMTNDEKHATDDDIFQKYLLNINNSFEPSNDPCTDFYEYTCGKKSQIIPSEPSDPMKELEEWIATEINLNEDKVLTTVKKDYKLCMNMVERNKYGMDYLLSMVNEDGGWPMVETNWSTPTNVSLLETQKYHSSLFVIKIRKDGVYIGNENFSVYGQLLSNELKRNIPDSPQYIRRVKELIAVIKNHRGLNITKDEMNQDLINLMEFRSMLHEISRLNPEPNKNHKFVAITIEELQSSWNDIRKNEIVIDWLKFIRNVLNNVQVDKTTKVYVNLDYMRNLCTLLKITEHRNLANHLKLHFFESYMGETTESLKTIYHGIKESMLGRKIYENDSLDCLKKPHLSRLLSYTALMKWYPHSTKTAAKKMIDNLKKMFEKYIHKNQWMNENTKKSLVQELKATLIIIGGESKYWRKDLIHPYSQYNITANYLETVINANRRIKDIEYAHFNDTEDVVSCEPHVFDTNIIFKPKRSMIILPIAYLRKNILSPAMPKEYAYASLGRVISGLLIQHLILKGLQYSIQRNDWYNLPYGKVFPNLDTCFVSQQSKQTILWSGTKNPQTVRMDLYDQIAAEIAFETFKHSVFYKDLPKYKKKLIRRRDRRGFFLALGNKFCQTDLTFYEYYPEIYGSRYVEKGKIRLNRMVANVVGFRKAFKCEKSSPMNACRLCSFWKGNVK